MGRNKTTAFPDSYVVCHVCGQENNADMQCYRITNNHHHGNDFCGVKCSQCKTVLTVVITERGVNTIENMIIQKSKANPKD